MHLASMVHSSGREREAHDHRLHLQQQHQQYHHQQHQQPSHLVSYPQHPPHPQARHFAVPTSAASSQYSAPPSAAEYQYQRHPQSPPSPPVEEQKPSLPSISSLLGIADGDKAASESAGQSPRSQQHPSPQLRQEEQQRTTAAPAHHGQKMSQPAGESRPDQAPSGFGPAANVSNPRMTLPPTPPMHPDSVVDGNQSPSAASAHSATSAPYFLGSSLNNMEPHQQRQTVPAPPSVKRHSVPSQPSMSPFNASAYAQSPYASSPGAASTASYYSPETHAYNQVGIYQQRPLPSTFQPQNMTLPVPTNTANANANGVWQHHHYISASSQAAFPQSQDRYICSTCNKAFSRPSSLRIHSHSHTGEKPYKCPQPGCGKAFSVRSNMKRHERGCHASASTTITTT